MKATFELAAAAFASLLACASSAVCAFDLGVNTHFGKGMGDSRVAADWVGRSGINTIRDELYWYDVERAHNKFAADGRAARALQTYRNMARQGVKVSLLLGYGNNLYDGGSQPFSEDGRKAFARYSEWVALETSSYVGAYEIWNEWNIGSGTRPKVRHGDPEGYAQLVAAVVPTLRSNSRASIVAGGLGDDLGNWPWARTAARVGAFDSADAISVHLYNYSVPLERAGAEEMIGRARDFVNAVSGSKPVWINEVGWPTHTGKFGLSESQAARELTKFLLGIRSVATVAGVWIYELFDSGDDASEREHRFGLLRRDGIEKPAGCRLRSIGSMVRGASFVSRFEQRGVVGYVLRVPDGYLIGAWPTRRSPVTSAAVRLQVAASSISPLGGGCGDGLDQVASRTTNGGGTVITASEPGAPVVFRLRVTAAPVMHLDGAN